MRSEARLFLIISGFMYLIGGIYAWGTNASSTIEWSGTVTLLLAGTLLAICGLYFGFIARRLVPRPEDRGDADISERAGTVGFFAPSSYWPFGIGLSTMIGAIGIGIDQLWLLYVGAVGGLLTVGGLAFEFYASGGFTRGRRE